MSAHRTTRTITRFLAVGAAVAVGLLGLAGTASATDEADGDCGYAAPEVVETTLVLALDSVKQGQSTTATATVRVGGKNADEGSVTFAVAGYASETVPLSGGQATYTLPSDLPAGTYEVTADAEVPGCTLPAGASAVIVVEGDIPPDDDEGDEDDEAAGVTGSAGRAAPVVGGTTGLLPNVGLDAGISLVALTGALLLAAGALVLLRFRRTIPGRHRG
ncbi:MAG TPA: Ig-like domain-containing protein [Nocardioidaceae bacterium]